MTMMNRLSKDTFNLTILNVILGLQKGSRLLKPYSNEFQLLGYSLFAINKEFSNSDKTRISPDIILNSNSGENTLLIETTYSDVSSKTNSEKKLCQIDRYKLSDKEYLSTAGQIPEKSLGTFDVPFIVHSGKFHSYKEYFVKNDIEFPIMVFTDEKTNDYLLTLKHNNLSNKKTHLFFNREMRFDRIPAYIELDFEDFEKTKEILFDKVAKCLIKFLQRNPKNASFNATTLAIDTLRRNIYELLSDDNKKAISRVIDKYLHELLNYLPELKTKFFDRNMNTHHEYIVLLDDRNKETEIKRFIKKIHDTTYTEILNKVPFQLSLFDKNYIDDIFSPNIESSPSEFQE
jgi:hypothetical protein